MNTTQKIADDVHGHEHEPSDDDIDNARTNLESKSEDDNWPQPLLSMTGLGRNGLGK